MNWIFYTLIAIGIVGVSDLFRKLASNLKDPFFTNLVFQLASSSTAIILYFMFSRKMESNPKALFFAVLGGITISLFSLFSFKALSTGPGASVVIPTLRIGGITLLVILGIVLLKEKLSLQTFIGLLFSAVGIYLLFSNK